MELLTASKIKELTHNKVSTWYMIDDTPNLTQLHSLKFHDTKVIRWNDDKIILTSGGWRTPTTKRRINDTADIAGLGIHIYQTEGNWYVSLPDGRVTEFVDDMVIMR